MRNSGVRDRVSPAAGSRGWLIAGLAAATLASGACGTSKSAAGGGAGMTSMVDRARCDDRGKQVVTADTNDDKRPDVIKIYSSVKRGGETAQALMCKQVDLNHDGKIDIVYHYGDDGATSFEEFDLDFDNRFDLRAFYQGGRKVREEMDTNYDQRVDFTKYYEADRLVRIERDGNNDGRVDEWMYYEAGKLDRIGYDTTGSGRVDKWERAPEAEAAAEAGPAAPAGAPPAATPPAGGAPAPAGGAPPAGGATPAGGAATPTPSR
jgi:hypothetical protein